MLICLVEVTLSKLVHPLDGESNKNIKFDKHYFNLVCYLTGLGPLNPSSQSYDADNTNTTIIWYPYPNYVLMQHVTLTNAEILVYKIPQLGVTKLTVNPKFQYFIQHNLLHHTCWMLIPIPQIHFTINTSSINTFSWTNWNIGISI